MTEKEQKQDNKTKLLFVIIAILVILNGVQWFINYQSSQKNQELLENKELELVTTYAKLDSISTQLDEKIEEIRGLNGNVDSLLSIKAELERDKQELKTSKSIAQGRYNKIKSKVEAYEDLLKKKDAEIAKLKEVNKTLLTETQNLKKDRNNLKDSISNLKQERISMSEKITTASALKAVNIRFEYEGKSGKAKEDTEFKERRVSKINMHFNLDDNPLTPIGGKTIFMRLIEPEGGTLYNISAGSGTFKFKGDDMFFTAKESILFDNSRQLISFTYTKENTLKKGKYKVMFYCNDFMIGESSFIIK